MDFGDRIKSIRKECNLTQEDFSQKLNITRQAVSNWENNRNLPDIEMLITIACVFHISLDSLILGGDNMNNMTEKLIKDGAETRKMRLNLICTCIGTALLIIGIACLVMKAVSVSYVDADGVLHENFFLLPIAFAFLFGGFVTFLANGIRNIVALFQKNSPACRKNTIIYLISSMLVTVICLVLFLLLRMSNA